MIRINPTTYVPVLRWKGAEQTAISQTTNNIRRRMVPIIEPVLRDFLPVAGATDMSAFAKSLAETCGWGPERPLLLDPHLLGDELASVVIPRFARAAQKYHITFGLVTGISRSESYQLSVQEMADQMISLCESIRRNFVVSALMTQSIASPAVCACQMLFI